MTVGQWSRTIAGRTGRGALRLCVRTFFAMMLGIAGAQALTIELKDVAKDRIERQKNFSVAPAAPLPGTPDTAKLEARLTDAGLKAGAPIFLRIFKAESELELWMRKDGAFERFATYPICNWSGSLGPKLREGDKQTPEGFYTITARQLHRLGRWKHALNLGFPNAYDESLKRDGSYILVHGGCSSVGCFAMTDAVILEIFQLTSAALRGGQSYVPVHVFPFRMTDESLAKHRDDEWSDFWANLKEGYDSFERTKRPPVVSVCQGRYVIEDAPSPQEAGSSPPLAVCGETAARILAFNGSAWLVPLQSPPTPASALPASLTAQDLLSPEPSPEVPEDHPRKPLKPGMIPGAVVATEQIQAPWPAATTSLQLAAQYELIPRFVSTGKPGRAAVAAAHPGVNCNMGLASCRKFAALLERRLASAYTARHRKPTRTAANKAR